MDNIDWSGIQAAAAAVGIREAARQATALLPPDEARKVFSRILKRSTRQQWTCRTAEAIATKHKLSTNVHIGSEIVKNCLAQDSEATRNSLSRATLKGAKHLETQHGEDIVNNAPKLRQLAAAAATVHGWDTGEDKNVTLNLLMMQGGTEL